MLVDRLRQRYPDRFSFIRVRGDRVEVGLTDPSVDIQTLIPSELSNVTPISAVYSEQERDTKAGDLMRQVSAAGLKNVSFGVNPETGRIQFLTKKSRAALEAAIKAGRISVEHGYDIIDDEIVPTAALYGGHAYNVNPSYCVSICGGTTGFSLIASATGARYISTAAHIDNGPARYNTSNTSTYASGGVSIKSPTDMNNNTYKLDVAYASPSDAASNTPYPYFWDGASYVAVTNYTYLTAGVQFCKYGRKTGKTCGVHDVVQEYCNPDYNSCHIYRILPTVSGAKLNDEDDSGGPVYYGNYALGWMHGKDNSGNLYYTAVDDFKRVQNSAIDLIVYR